MNLLQDNGFMTSCVGKIGDIFDQYGVVKTQKTVSNEDGMDKTIEEAKSHDFTGLCFVNLVEFDSEYGHRRNPQGYGKAIEDFDKQLGEFMAKMNDDDLVMVTADHGNDPTYKGSDHTRENVPLLVYSKQFKNGRMLPLHESFAGIGATIIENFGIKKTTQIGEPIKELLED
jgi:phosphopentomutase